MATRGGEKMKAIFFANIIAEEGPGFVLGQIRQALEEAGVLYKSKSFPNTNPVEFDRKAIKELEKCGLLVCGFGEALSLLRKAKKQGTKILGLSFSLQVEYRERIFDNILFRYGVNIKDRNAHRTTKAEKFVDYFPKGRLIN